MGSHCPQLDRLTVNGSAPWTQQTDGDGFLKDARHLLDLAWAEVVFQRECNEPFKSIQHCYSRPGFLSSLNEPRLMKVRVHQIGVTQIEAALER